MASSSEWSRQAQQSSVMLDRIWPAAVIGLGVLITAVWIGFLTEMVMNLVSTAFS
jgi:hypothetical protein